MAEESASGRTTFEDLMFALFGLMLLGNIFHHGQTLLQEKYGIVLGPNEQGVLVASAGLAADTPIGTRVEAPNGAPYYATSGAAEDDALGSFIPGATLVLKDGPEVDENGVRWWYVEEETTGKKGWIKEHGMVKAGAGGLDARTQLGTRVRALTEATVWDKPAFGVGVGTLALGEWAELARGPEINRGTRWWFIERDGDGADGWVPESALTLFSEQGWQPGSPVVSTRNVDLYERAGGGGVIGFMREEQKATVRGGPTLVGGSYWWYVETDDGVLGWVPETALEPGGVRGVLRGIVATLVIVGSIITLVLVGGIVYVTVRTNQIRAREAKRIREAVPQEMQPKRNDRWDKVLEHVSSENPNDWRLAIIEADIMLDEVVMRMGFQGGTLGDRLKQIAKGDLRTLDAAWEAHKVRNQIAHEGSDYILTQREARRVIDLYGAVFEEVKFI